MGARKLTLGAGRLLATILLAGFLGASLVRLAPGEDVDELELDARLSQSSREKLQASRAAERDLAGFYWRYLAGLARGDLGRSRSLNRPVADLLAERFPVTLRSAGIGLAVGWTAGLLVALVGVFLRHPAFDLSAAVLSGAFLSLPSALLALLLLLAGAPAAIGIAAVIFPRAFRYAHDSFCAIRARPHLLTAEARGLPRLRIVLWHVLPPAFPQLVALAGVTLSVAFGAAIPIEVICDSPGIGQLAWTAALGRDLTTLVNLTLVIAAFTVTANWLADLGVSRLAESRP